MVGICRTLEVRTATQVVCTVLGNLKIPHEHGSWGEMTGYCALASEIKDLKLAQLFCLWCPIALCTHHCLSIYHLVFIVPSICAAEVSTVFIVSGWALHLYCLHP